MDAVSPMAPAAQPSVCMFVYNTCRTDARVLKEAASLTAAGYRVQIVALLDGATEPVEQRTGSTIVRIGRKAPRRPRSLGKALLLLEYYARTHRLVRGQRFDVYHAHDLDTLPLAAMLARRAKARLVYDSHELYPEISTHRPLARRLWRRLESALIHRADAVVTVCESIADELAKRYRVATPLTLLNCPPAAALPAASPVSRLRERAGLVGDTRRIVLYQGGLVPNRGLPQLIEAARDLDDAVVVLLGWGKLEDTLRRQIREDGLGDRVLIVPAVEQDELLGFTAGADLGVIPYERVGLNNYYAAPNKLFEYIAAGLPVIGSRFPELRRYLEGLDLGRTCDPNPKDIAATANAILGDEELRARLAANAREAAKRLVWEEESRKLVDLYAGFGISAGESGYDGPDGRATGDCDFRAPQRQLGVAHRRRGLRKPARGGRA